MGHRCAPGGVRVERELRLYSNRDLLTVGGRIVNGSAAEVHLGTADLLSIGDQGGWELGSSWEAPAAVYIEGHSLLRSTPFAPAGSLGAATPQQYHSSGVLALAGVTLPLCLSSRAVAASPSIASVNPTSGAQGQTMDVAIVGSDTNFVDTVSVASFGSGISVISTTVTYTTHATANIAISPSASPGTRDVNVTTGSLADET